MKDGIDPGPEAVGIKAGTRQGLLVNEAVQFSGHLQAMAINAFSHQGSLLLRGEPTNESRPATFSQSLWLTALLGVLPCLDIILWKIVPYVNPRLHRLG